MKRGNRPAALSAFLVLILTVLLSNCNGGHHPPPPPPVPAIQNINFSTTPSSAANWSVEINGTGFQSTPGKVIFTQGSNSTTVVPGGADWSNTGIVVLVPTGFTGTVSVTVMTSGGTSNANNLNLVSPVTLATSSATWKTTTPLPTAMSGLGAVAVPGVAGPPPTAFVVVAGGYDGANNSTQVRSNNLNSDGTVGANWMTIATNALPSSRAHFGMVEADDGNSLVPVGSRFIYVIGGQQLATDLPGGTTTVFMASVNSTTGAVGAWSQLASSLPAAVVGPAATVFNGHIYVVGGLTTPGGIPSGAVYTAIVNNDGTLGAWSTSANAYPTPVSFATVFGFSENLYVLGGDTITSTDPNEQKTNGITTAEFAPAHFGTVGAWTSTSPTVANREKHDTWHLFGQILDAEGIYTGTPGTDELEQTTVNSDGTLAAWSSVAAANAPGANVFNAAAIVSPLLHPTSTGVLAPRVLLLGGAAYSLSTPGLPLSSSVFYNNAP